MQQKESLTGFFESMNRRNLEEMGNLLTEESVFYFPKAQPLIGKDRILKFFKVLFRQYPVLTFDIQRTIIQENQAAIHWTNKGHNRKELPYANEGVTIIEMDNARIRFMSDFFKDTEKF